MIATTQLNGLLLISFSFLFHFNILLQYITSSSSSPYTIFCCNFREYNSSIRPARTGKLGSLFDTLGNNENYWWTHLFLTSLNISLLHLEWHWLILVYNSVSISFLWCSLTFYSFYVLRYHWKDNALYPTCLVVLSSYVNETSYMIILFFIIFLW